MGAVIRELPADNVSRGVILCVMTDGKCFAMATEEGYKVQDPSVINIRIGRGQAPLPGVGVKSSFHVFMDQDLKINAEFTISTYYQICAHAGVVGNIASRVWDSSIRRVVNDDVSCALGCMACQLPEKTVATRRHFSGSLLYLFDGVTGG